MDLFEKLALTLAVLFIYVAFVIVFWLLTQNVPVTYFTAGLCIGAFVYSILPIIWD